MNRSRKSRIKEEETQSHQSRYQATIRDVTGNSRKNQNSIRENKQHSQYKWSSDRMINNNHFMPGVPFHLDPLLRNPKQQPIKQNIQEINHNPNINLDFEETHHFKKASCQRCFKDWTNHSSKIQKN